MSSENQPDPYWRGEDPDHRELGGAEYEGLSRAEFRRRRRDLYMSFVVMAVIIALVLIQPLTGLIQGVGDSALFLFLNGLTVILIALLVFLITRNFYKLFLERRRGILGSRLNLKFVFAFILISLVPTTVLFVISAGFIRHSIDKWFSLEVDRALDQSSRVVEIYYEAYEKNALFYGKQIASLISEERLLREDNLEILERLVQQKQHEYNLGVVEIFSSTGEELVTAVNPDIPTAMFARPEADFVLSALAGNEDSLIEELGTSDMVRGAVPIKAFRSPDQDVDIPDQIVGVVVVNYLVPISVARQAADIRAALDGVRRDIGKMGSVSTAYQLELLLAFMVVMLLATWMGFRLAKGVTGPIRALAEGTAEVARGNLDVTVAATTDDEVGFLVQSFNKMIQDLRDTRRGLELSNAELDQRRRYMEIVLRNVGGGVVSVDAEGRVSTINPAAQRFLGIPPGIGLTGKRINELLDKPELQEVLDDLESRLQAGVRESIRREIEVPGGDGVLTLLVTLTLLQDDDGQRVGAVMVIDDYSQLVKVQRMVAWREVARRIAHEIKNPLTPIQLSAQRIRRRFRDGIAKNEEDVQIFDESVDAILTQVDDLKLLVNEFSNFARLPTANPKPGDFNQIVREVLASYAETEGVAFSVSLDSELPIVDLDKEQMRRVLTNLIDNAIAGVKQVGEGHEGKIEVLTVHDKPLQSIRLEVVDNGVGIAPGHQREVFDPYFSTKKHGTGLGLAIVSRIIADHNGYIRVHDNEPKGARFIVELPTRR